jgi:hypothetical protein
MKKMFVMAALLACFSAGSALAQSEVSKTTKPATAASHKEASCCSKKSSASAACADGKEKQAEKAGCSDNKKSAAGKSSCCNKGGHTEAKAETPAEKKD